MTQNPITIEAESYNKPVRLPVRHISACVEDTLATIEQRRSGELTSLKTGFNSLDRSLLGGIE